MKSTVSIRPYQESDFDEICSWWNDHQEFAPLPGMMTEDGTFVLELDNVPVMTLSCLKTQSKEISYFEGYCSRPDLPKNVRNELGKQLFIHGYQYLKALGYTRVIIMTEKEALARRYERLGMTPNLSGITTLGRML